MKENRLGSGTPDAIWGSLEHMIRAVEACQPFEDIRHENNVWMMKVLSREAEKITRHIESLQSIHGIGWVIEGPVDAEELKIHNSTEEEGS